MYDLDLFDPETWPSVLTPAEIAMMARQSVKSVRRRIQSGEIKAVTVSKDPDVYRVAKESYLDYLRRCEPATARRIGEQQHAEHIATGKRRRAAATAN